MDRIFLRWGRRGFVRARCAALIAAALTPLITGCISDVGPTNIATSASTSASECLVDGVPLASIDPPVPVCQPGAPSEVLANALRSYQQERNSEAAALFGAEVGGTPAAERTTWWQQARFFLAKTYVHLERRRAAEELFLQIVRTPDDAYRWAAAHWMCRGQGAERGQSRPAQQVSVFLPYGTPACRDTSRDAAYVPSTGPLPSPRPDPPAEAQPLNRQSMHAALTSAWRDMEMCGDGRGGSVVIALVFGPSGDPTSVSLQAGAFFDGTPVAGTPVEACVLAVARRIWLPAFMAERFVMPMSYPLR